MNIIFQNSNHLEGNILLELAEQDYMPQVDEAIKKYRNKTELRGFRKGQAPYGVIKKMYGPEVLFQTVMETVKKILLDYINTDAPALWGTPIMSESPFYDSKVDVDSPGTLNFKFECGLIPTIDFKQLESIEIEKYTINEVTEATVEKAIKDTQLRYGTSTEVTKSEPGDILYGMLTNGENYSKFAYFPADLTIGDKVQPLLGIETNQQATLHLHNRQSYVFPASHIDYKEMENLVKSLDGDYQFTASKIYRSTPEALNQDFFSKVLGGDKTYTLDEFKSEFKNIFITHAKTAADSFFNKAIKKELLKQLVFDIPENYIKKQLHSKYNNYSNEALEEAYQHMVPDIRWSLIIDKFAEEKGIEITVGDIIGDKKLFDHDASDLREEFNRKIDKSFLAQDIDDKYKEAYDAVLQKKSLDKIKDILKVRLQEKSLEEFQELLK